SSDKVDKMNEFYLKVMNLQTETEGLPVLEKNKGYSGDVAFVSDGKIQTHLAEKDLDVCFNTGHSINPLEKGHIAYRTDDLNAFKKHLDKLKIKYSDWGETAVAGWKQIFFYDPDGNVIEVHEVTN
ncbi:VOC family protein, partial [Alphaproteobacteria bacterium]|nr:VOC family protein [Alphaproteobacteria bacterium]